MFTKKTVVLMALVAGTFAAESIRNRLGQLSTKTLAQESNGGGVGSGDDWCVGGLTELPPIELPECPCNFSELPGLGSGHSNGFKTEAQALQSQFLESVPDTQYSQICQSNCCSCEEASHAGYTNARKNRTFTIAGSISVLETLRVQEKGEARENSKGFSEKDTICQTNNAEGGLGSGNECVEVKVCPLEANLGAPPKGGKDLGLSRS